MKDTGKIDNIRRSTEYTIGGVEHTERIRVASGQSGVARRDYCTHAAFLMFGQTKTLTRQRIEAMGYSPALLSLLMTPILVFRRPNVFL